MVSHYRLVRDSAVVAQVKALHDHLCQVCGQEVRTLTGRYAEGAHVVPLGGEYGGPDVVENVLCLCPNDHARFDHGGIFISDAFEVFDADKNSLGLLRLHEKHRLGVAYLRAHREMFGY
jgi:putative restriction endonuclease